ncbi:LysE/ArgO family amino acid transporter [Arthrobacter sp. M4]|uniref:LysE/ArgO family amino acid transporter n=1 Tax=Arthrobacter sp. M4 TaxID=218160 RepID=UPI001CDCEAAD|nr:LysE/ArgO family amino acid transporter [Arthrobacter sp. M4]MCA4133819.1 LysE/ArgO family amino acid transporter [Arthrobacter sp. M4]
MQFVQFLQAAGTGLAAGLALIVVIGAQNAFVLRQGILGKHVVPIVLVCALSDALLIAAGVVGMGAVVESAPIVVVVLRYLGAAFLLCYGFMAARRVFTSRHLVTELDQVPAAVEHATATGGSAQRSALAGGGSPTVTVVAKAALVVEHPAGTAATKACAVVATALVFTWLNPHVYLDTVVLLGSLAAEQGPGMQWAFGAGAMVASSLWFSALGFGARLLRGVFARPASWRILDVLIAATMTALALSMALGS